MWYKDPTTLLEEVQRGRRPRPRPPTIAGYDDFQEIRRGGQGVVYQAIQRSTKRLVAVKVFYEDAFPSEQRKRRFEREIELVAGLRHPGIVTVYDSGAALDGRLYLVMEYVEGRSLGQWIAECESRVADCLPLFARICEAVQYAHQRGVIHRDLKPSNILVVDGEGLRTQDSGLRRDPAARTDYSPLTIHPLRDRQDACPTAQPKVLDFGLAKDLGERSSIRHPKSLTPEAGVKDRSEIRDLTVTGHFMGTLAYASPEQLSGDPSRVDVRTDVYALGVILYEMLAGAHPYALDGSMAGLIQAIERSDPVPPSKKGKKGDILLFQGSRQPHPKKQNVPFFRELDTIVLTALKKDPADRYQSVAALRDDLARYLDGRPIDAKRDSGWYVFTKTLRRHRLPAAAAAGFLVLIVAFGVAMSVLYRRARVEADKANQIRIFLEDTLGSVEPVQPGHEVTVRETLDEAVHWVELALAGQPEVAASLRTTIGNSYRSLGLHEPAERQLNLALETRRELFGQEHSQVAQSLNALGMLYRDRGDLTAAEDHLRRALAMRRSLLGDKHPDVAMTLQNLAGVLHSRGDSDEAGRALREARDIQRQRLGDQHPDVAMCVFRLGELKEAAGDFAVAEALHAEALAVRRAGLPREHPDVSRSLIALAEARIQGGDAAGAEPLLRECIEIGESISPGNPARLAEAHRLLAECLTALGRPE